jgi:Glyoxalase/Bleomycin resistance protein/Dioxygenase superfamily
MALTSGKRLLPLENLQRFVDFQNHTGSAVMSPAIERLMYEDGQITRRNLLLALGALVMAPRVMAQSSKPPIVTRRLNNVMISVSEMERSLEFYQKLFGTPVKQGDVAIFRLGDGPHFFAISEATRGARPGFTAYGMTIDDFPDGS